MKLLNLLFEDFTLENEKDLTSSLKFSFGKKRLDYFFINYIRRGDGTARTRRVGGVKVYFGLIPNFPVRELSSDDLDIIYHKLKNESNISYEDIKFVVQNTGPYKIPYDFIISIPSSSSLNRTVSSVFKQLNPNKACKIITLENALYTVDAMVDEEKYQKADPTTKKMVDTYIKRLTKLYGLEKELPIKVSPNPETGHPGLQSGARSLLKNKFKDEVADFISKNVKVLVVDDILVSGDTLQQAFTLLENKKINKSNMTGFVFATKDIPESMLQQLSIDINDPEKYRLK